MSDTVTTRWDEFDRSLELAVVIPTYNEAENIEPLLQRLDSVLAGVRWEAIFVDDDSPDRTSHMVSGLARRNCRVRILRRVGRRGLASACIEGMLATSAPYIAVMDADLQHDERVLPEMLHRIRSQALDLVVASRNVEGGSMGQFAKGRVRLSGLGMRLSRLVARCGLTDPMSGFFVVSREFLEEVVYRLSGVGFKILLDLAASAQRPISFAEVPYTFRTRQHGESKLDVNVGLEFLYLVMDKLIGNIVPARFVLYSMVGLVGLALHLAILSGLLHGLHEPFLQSQIAATGFAIILNFVLNNKLTFRERKLKGTDFVWGLMAYCAACLVGLVTNVSVADFCMRAGGQWWLSGIAGLSISSVWNYGVTSVFTWKRKQRLQAAVEKRERLRSLQACR